MDSVTQRHRGFFNAEIDDRENMSKVYNKIITEIDYDGQTVLVLWGSSSGASLLSFTAVIDTSFGIASPSISKVFRIFKVIAKTCKKSNFITLFALLARTKLNSINKDIWSNDRF